MSRHKNVELKAHLGSVIRHMSAVEEYRKVLQNLQAAWDNLTLLGQLSGAGTDMSGTRQAFTELTGSLLDHLGSELLAKGVLEMSAKAQVAIDILVRNLFERTADIGFLATDDDIRRFIARCADRSSPTDARELDAGRAQLRARFAEYVAKYSVYSDIILLDLDGRVLARLDETVDVACSTHPLVAEALGTAGAYVETYGAIDFLPKHERALVYSFRVTDTRGAAVGILCLCFRFENEMERIFANLANADDWSVILLLDAHGTVVASSDRYHVPVGAKVQAVIAEDYRVVRFGAQQYLAKTRPTKGYQGYMGPGWFGHVLLPIQHAFNKDASEVLRSVDASLLEAVMSNASLFGDALRNIPVQAERIQRELNRSVWNGNVRQRSAKQALNASFSKILLGEISNTGARTKEVFERSISNLHETVVSSILQESRFLASLAIDIMDRNLYERANDCRWWALTSDFRDLLALPRMSADAAARIAAILQTINGLYTVYANLAVFDVHGLVLAVSQPAAADWVGRTVDADWVHSIMVLPDSQGYAVSPFAATPLYGGQHTYVYGAAIRAPQSNRVVGAVALVFDAAPQFAAMLRDALPKNEAGEVPAGCFGLFVEANGGIVACSDDRYRPGDRLPFDDGFLAPIQAQDERQGHACVVRLGERYFAVGARVSCGYREYKGEQDPYRNDIIALVFVPLCEAAAQGQRGDPPHLAIRSDRAGAGETVEIATFPIGRTWFGLRSEHVVEAMEMVHLTRVPGTGPSFAGYLMYQGAPVAVYDIRDAADAGPAWAGVQHQINILKKGENSYFGIVADGLGEIPEIALTRLHPMPAFLAGQSALADSVISVDGPEHEHLLPVLSIDRIAGHLGITAGQAAPLVS